MTDIHADLSTMSDADLSALEQDTSLPIDRWMAVEAELGRRKPQGSARGAPSPAAASAGAGAAPATNVPGSAQSVALEDASIQRALSELNGLLVPGERLHRYAVERRLFALLHRRHVVGATSGRFVALSRGLFGGYTPFDVRWQDLRDADIRAGMFGATITITLLQTEDLASRDHAGGRVMFRSLRKEQAQQVYRICQAQEQAWREKRRVRDLDELRAESGGVSIGQVPGTAGAVMSAGGDPTDRLRRAKEMLDQGLITDAEYEAIKARVVETL